MKPGRNEDTISFFLYLTLLYFVVLCTNYYTNHITGHHEENWERPLSRSGRLSDERRNTNLRVLIIISVFARLPRSKYDSKLTFFQVFILIHNTKEK